MDLPKSRTALAAGVAVAVAVTSGLAFVVWPALVRPEPPLEKTSDDGLRIRLVEPPRTATKAASPLDVGLSQAAQAMAKGREALLVRTPPVRPLSPAAQPPAAPIQVAEADDEEDASAPIERDEAGRRDRFEPPRHRRWEEERLAREAQDERAAWREASDRRRWEEERERDRYENRYTRPREEDREPSRERW